MMDLDKARKAINEVDEEMARYTKESYPPALARSTAVKKIHLKYSGNKHGCSPEEIMEILNLTPGDLVK